MPATSIRPRPFHLVVFLAASVGGLVAMGSRSMPTHRRKRPPATRRRALELLTSCRDGCTEAIMLAHGFTVEQMVEIIRAGLATAQTERVVARRAHVRNCAVEDHRGGAEGAGKRN
jgi:hypothetical protein